MGGWPGVEATPIEIIQRQRAIIVATMNYEAEQAEEMKRKQEEREREFERMKARYR